MTVMVKVSKNLWDIPFSVPLEIVKALWALMTGCKNLQGNIYTAHASSNFIDKIDTGFCSGCIDGVKAISVII